MTWQGRRYEVDRQAGGASPGFVRLMPGGDAPTTIKGMGLAFQRGMHPERGRVLVVDDDPDWTSSITDLLNEEGYEASAVPNGLAALERFSQIEPGVIITDLEMPVMNGRQLLVNVRAFELRVPVIVVTGERVMAGDASLADAFRIIRKPVPVEELLADIADATVQRGHH